MHRLTRVSVSSIGDDLHQQDTEAPDVALDGKPVVQHRLWCRPLDGELAVCWPGTGLEKEWRLEGEWWLEEWWLEREWRRYLASCDGS